MPRCRLLLLVSVVASTGYTVVRAEIPKLSEDQLMRAASHVFAGWVVQTYVHRAEKSGEFEYTFGVAEIMVARVEKGSQIASDDRVFVRYWRRRWVGDGRPPPGHNGHWNIPVAGNVVRVFVAGDRSTGFDVLSPNGFFSVKKSVITPTRVGPFVIGKSTRREILRTSHGRALVLQEHRRFMECGLYFEFNHRKELTRITVRSPQYELENGICVGVSERRVVELLGEPRRRQIVTGKRTLKALVYSAYTFLIDDAGKVAAIRVGRAQR